MPPPGEVADALGIAGLMACAAVGLFLLRQTTASLRLPVATAYFVGATLALWLYSFFLAMYVFGDSL
jgi:hypothetical protein